MLKFPQEVFVEIELQDQSMQFELTDKHKFDKTFPEFSLHVREPSPSDGIGQFSFFTLNGSRFLIFVFSDPMRDIFGVKADNNCYY